MEKLNDYQLMIKARNLVRRKNGWVRGKNKCEIRPGFFAYCARGAVFKVARSEKQRIKLFSYLKQAMPPQQHGITYYIDTITYYNDTVLGAQKDVVAWFQRAIRKAAKAEGLSVTV